jgi:hypothetical protein
MSLRLDNQREVAYKRASKAVVPGNQKPAGRDDAKEG